MITVYTKDNCPMCDATKRFLTKRGADFEAVPATQEHIDGFVAEGFQQMPIVEANGTKWSGYRPDLLAGALA